MLVVSCLKFINFGKCSFYIYFHLLMILENLHFISTLDLRNNRYRVRSKKTWRSESSRNSCFPIKVVFDVPNGRSAVVVKRHRSKAIT